MLILNLIDKLFAGLNNLTENVVIQLIDKKY